MKTSYPSTLRRLKSNPLSHLPFVFFLSLILLPCSRAFPQVINPSFAGVISDGSGNTPSLTSPNAVFVSGNYAYVVNGQGLEIVDITLPGLPLHKGSLTNGTGGALLLGATSIYVSGNYAYVASYFSRALEIVDLSDPTSPIHKASLFVDLPLSVFVVGNYAYVARNGGSTLIIDISDPGSPSIKGSVDTGPGVHHSIYVAGNYAYITSEIQPALLTGTNSLQIVDVTDPAAPALIGSLEDGTDGALLSSPYSVYVFGNYAYVASAGSNALEIIDVTDPAAPFHKGSLTNGTEGALLNFPQSIRIVGSDAYVVSSGSNALEVVDISDPALPVHKGSLTHGMGGAILDRPTSIYIVDNHAYVTSGNGNALEIVDVTSAAAPVHRGNLNNGTGGALLRGPGSVYVSGNYAYVTSTVSDALEIVDITDPTFPIHKGSLTHGTDGALLDRPVSVYVAGDFAYIASYNSNALEIVDITNPVDPLHKGVLASGTGGALLDAPTSVYVVGNYAYVASRGSHALEIVDVSDPSSPVHFGSLAHGAGGALLEEPVSVFVAGSHAYVASFGSDALEIVDVANPAAPFHKGNLTNGTGGALLDAPRSVYVAGDLAYVVSDASGSSALEIVDISDPTLPIHKGSLAEGEGGAKLFESVSVSVSGNYAYIAALGHSALEIVDVANPASPFHKASLRDDSFGALLCGPTSVYVSGSYVYLTSFCTDGLVIVNLHSPGITSFVPATGAVGTDITVTGQNFNTFISAAISGVEVPINEITATTINISVPSGVAIGPISVTLGKAEFTSASNFIVIPEVLSASSLQQAGFTASWSDVGVSAYQNASYYLDVSTDNFNTYVGSYENLWVGNTASFDVGGLSPGTAYQWRVRSSDGTTVSANSHVMSLVTIPEAPTANPATAISQTGFTANWSSVGNATGYHLDVASDPGFTAMIPGYINLALSSGTTAQIVSGLNSGTYYYRVRSSNAGGSSPSSGTTETTTFPSNPSTTVASAVTATGFTANWTAVEATSYSIDISTDNFATFVTGFENLDVGVAISFVASGLNEGTSYQYRVRANNTTGPSGNSNVTALLTFPAAPPESTVSSILPNQFSVSWTQVNGANAYYLDVAADSLFSTVTYANIQAGNVSSYIVSGLSSSSVYYFRLRSGNQTGLSINSKFVSVTTLATTVVTQSSSLAFTGISGTALTLNYIPGSGTSHLVVVSEGSPLTALPINRTSYSANVAYGQGSKIGNGYVVNTGLSPVTITGLSPATVYYFQVFDFNGTSGTENYNIAAAANNPVSQTTLSAVPLSQPTDFVFSNQTGTSVNISFNAAAGSPAGYLVLRSAGSGPNFIPAHGITYSTGSIHGNSTVAFAGSSLTFFEGGLPTNDSYYYAAYSYNGSGAAISYLTSVPLEGSVTLDVTPPVITPAVTNTSTITNSSTPTLSTSIVDDVEVASAQFFYKGISQEEFKTAQMNFVGGDTYSVTIQPDWYDELGLEYYFIATDGNGNTTNRAASSYAQIKNQILSLPTLPAGTEQTSYRIRAFPYVLPTDNKVETIYGSDFKDNTKATLLWWDPSLNGGSGDYLRYGTESGIQTIDPGKGYWVLSASDIKPQLNDVPAPKYNSSNLFTMTLKPKWNEIGNPYPVPISWDDVIAYNAEVNPGAVFSRLNVYDGTGYKVATDGTMLNPYEGGFVKNMTSSDITIQIPFPAQSNGGRVSSIGTDISRDDWNILLHIKQGSYVNELGGFGMHPLSVAGQDRHDNFNPPRFMDLPEVNFVNPEVPSLVFSNNMVATAAEYVWEFTPAGNPGQLAQLNWSQLSSSGSQQLFLLDEEQATVIDMNSTNHYEFELTNSCRFRVFFGHDVEKKITPQVISASSPFPNPLGADLRATVNIGLPDHDGAYAVDLQIFNMQGAQVGLVSRLLYPGIHSVELELSDAAAAGMHLYRLSVSSDHSSKVFTGKIIKP
jgi:hypothetical protein